MLEGLTLEGTGQADLFAAADAKAPALLAAMDGLNSRWAEHCHLGGAGMRRAIIRHKAITEEPGLDDPDRRDTPLPAETVSGSCPYRAARVPVPAPRGRSRRLGNHQP